MAIPQEISSWLSGLEGRIQTLESLVSPSAPESASTTTPPEAAHAMASPAQPTGAVDVAGNAPTIGDQTRIATESQTPNANDQLISVIRDLKASVDQMNANNAPVVPPTPPPAESNPELGI